MGMQVKVRKKRRVRLTLKAYAYPGLAAQRYQSLLVSSLPFVILGIILMLSAKTRYFGTGIVGWFLLSWGVAWMFSSAGDRSKIKKAGLKAKVMPNNFPEIKALVSEHCKSVGVKEPATYVMDDEAGRVRILGGGTPILVISASMREILKPEEFNCAVFRAIGELRTKSVGLQGMVRFMQDTSSLLRMCLFPAHFLTFLLQQNWVLLSNITTDRLLLITTRHPRVCLATIMHLVIEESPLAQIDHQDVEAYLQRRDGMQATTEGVSTHFMMGTALQTIPSLNERIQELIKYSASPEYKQLCEKIDEVLK